MKYLIFCVLSLALAAHGQSANDQYSLMRGLIMLGQAFDGKNTGPQKCPEGGEAKGNSCVSSLGAYYSQAIDAKSGEARLLNEKGVVILDGGAFGCKKFVAGSPVSCVQADGKTIPLDGTKLRNAQNVDVTLEDAGDAMSVDLCAKAIKASASSWFSPKYSIGGKSTKISVTQSPVGPQCKLAGHDEDCTQILAGPKGLECRHYGLSRFKQEATLSKEDRVKFLKDVFKDDAVSLDRILRRPDGVAVDDPETLLKVAQMRRAGPQPPPGASTGNQ